MEWTWALLLLIIGIVGIVGSQGFVKKSGKKRKNWTFFFGGIAIVGLLGMSAVGVIPGLSGPINLGDTFAVTGGDNSQGIDVDVTGCDLGTKTTVTLSAIDKYTSLATGGTHRYRINGAPAVDIADAGTFTASPEDQITVLWANESKTLYYGEIGEYKVPCAGAKTFYTELSQNGTLSSSLKDSDDIALEGSANNQTLSAGDVKTLSMKLSGTYQNDFPYGFVAVVEYNNTAIDDVILSTVDGVELQSDVVLQSYSATYGAVSSKKAYAVSAINSNADLNLKVTIDADDSVNPSVGTADVIVTLYPKDYFINEKNGGEFEGPSGEDETNTLTRSGGFTVTIYTD